MSDVDWNAIRADYERGVSLRQLASNYNISKTTLIRRRDSECWTTNRTGPDHVPPMVRLPVPVDAVSIARVGLSQLARYLEGDTLLAIKEHKYVSDALAQYVKVLSSAPPPEEKQEDGIFIPMSKISEETRAKIRAALAEDQQQGSVRAG